MSSPSEQAPVAAANAAPLTPFLATAPSTTAARVCIVGAGPAGLMAAEVLAAAGLQVDVFDAMPSVGRKFLLAGKGGLNLTHAEPAAHFVARYGDHADQVEPWLRAFDADAIRAWAAGLGIKTFVGSSGKVFPAEMKAAPLLRAWLHRLRVAGVRFHMRRRWNGTLLARDGQAGGGWQLAFDTPSGLVTAEADAVVLALGGASWARLGSDGAWLPWLAAAGVACAPLRPSNCGFDIGWSAHLTERHAGTPLKNVLLRVPGPDDATPAFERLGEAVISATGLEGSLVYAASSLLRERIAADGQADFTLDLLPHRREADLAQALAKGRGSRSWPNHLKEQTGLSGAPAALLREGLDAAGWSALTADPAAVAQRIKRLPLRARATRPIDEAISTAGGVRLGADGADEALMLRARPGVFVAGEMLDWEAPTGGYLLSACLASGRWAATHLARRLRGG
ncbi:TIGR03862 family flavoprotein [Leptothrix discophora]|uniref:TIGR03862 family flavoprotein n=1 Tax=Leptothrix discophora TaxID=89 RepID=A0ABT9G2T7_LEPDI|nr:TIGR03862 family flavoprotein [Leptothrix discophora]MDP4300802.1 TIGR03862 family flavoprotein [Leptothrix discophora]